MTRHIFLSYVRENASTVDRLAADLRALGVTVWLDRENIVPGRRWRDAIREAIRAGDLFVACFSREFLTRDVSYMNEELIIAIEELRLRPTDRAWFIPASLDGASIPPRSIGAGETLTDLQWVDLGSDWNRGVKMIAELAGASTSTNPRNSLTAKAANIGNAREMQKNWQQFIWTPEGVAAASSELSNLFESVRSIAGELAQKAPNLQIEFERAPSTCAVRVGKRSVLFSWLPSSVNEVEHARLYVLEYPWRYRLSGPNFSTLEPRKCPYRFAKLNSVYGWSSDTAGEFITSEDLAIEYIDDLLSDAESP